MSQKLIEFLVHFSNFYDNVIACFYLEICTVYQIYIFQAVTPQFTIPARIRGENSSMAKVRSRQGIEVATRSHNMQNEKKLRHKMKLLRLKKELKRRISCRDTILRSRHQRKTTQVATDN